MKSQKFKPPVMTRRGGGKHTTHDAKWLGDVVAGVAAGTSAGVKAAAPIAYHGQPPHITADIAPGPRPSVESREPQDVPDADDQTRHVDPTPYPTTHGHHKPGK